MLERKYHGHPLGEILENSIPTFILDRNTFFKPLGHEVPVGAKIELMGSQIEKLSQLKFVQVWVKIYINIIIQNFSQLYDIKCTW